MGVSNLEWIENTDKGARIKDLLKELTPEHDFFLGCYGNPDADVIFVPEILSLDPKEVITEAYVRHPERKWTTAWKATIPDLLFRNALYRNKIIDDPLSDKPSKWGCWITDFVKQAEYTSDWKKMKKRGEADELIRQGAKFLKRELTILNGPPNPIRWVIFVGGDSESYFQKYCKDLEMGFRTNKVYHYAWAKGPERKKIFFFAHVFPLQPRVNGKNAPLKSTEPQQGMVI